jgi:hypothetical protein
VTHLKLPRSSDQCQELGFIKSLLEQESRVYAHPAIDVEHIYGLVNFANGCYRCRCLC